MGNRKNPECQVRAVKKIATIVDILSAGGGGIYSEVHKLLCLYLTVPMTNATAERSFSTLRQLKTYLRSTMTEKRLNHVIFLHIHKELTDVMDLNQVLRSFCFEHETRRSYFGKW